MWAISKALFNWIFLAFLAKERPNASQEPNSPDIFQGTYNTVVYENINVLQQVAFKIFQICVYVFPKRENCADEIPNSFRSTLVETI